MKEARYFFVPQAESIEFLPQEEARHAIKVLRLKEGDDIFLLDGEGKCFRAEVTAVDKRQCNYRLLERIDLRKTWNAHIHLAIAPTKMIERMEWLVEKATEIGFDEISFLKCKYSERQNIRIDRIDRIAIAAMKQSRKVWKPIINDMTSFKSFIQSHPDGKRYIAHCYDEIPKEDLFQELNRESNDDQDIIVLVGPEGDFSTDEVKMAMEAGFVSVHLGQNRLRTETAGLYAVMMMQLATSRGYILNNV